MQYDKIQQFISENNLDIREIRKRINDIFSDCFPLTTDGAQDVEVLKYLVGIAGYELSVDGVTQYNRVSEEIALHEHISENESGPAMEKFTIKQAKEALKIAADPLTDSEAANSCEDFAYIKFIECVSKGAYSIDEAKEIAIVLVEISKQPYGRWFGKLL